MNRSTLYVQASIPNSNLKAVVPYGTDYTLEIDLQYDNGYTFVLGDNDHIDLWVQDRNGKYTSKISGSRSYYNKANFTIGFDMVSHMYSVTDTPTSNVLILIADVVITTEDGVIIPNSKSKDTINIIVTGDK